MIFARILTNFPENWTPVFSNQKMMGAIFPHTSTELVKVFRDFARILQRFSLNQNFWWCACTPCTPASSTSKLDMHNCRVTRNVVCRCSCRYTVYHTENNNHIDHNIGIIWHKLSMLINDSTVECNVSQEKKRQSRTYLRWRYGHKRNFLG